MKQAVRRVAHDEPCRDDVAVEAGVVAIIDTSAPGRRPQHLGTGRCDDPINRRRSMRVDPSGDEPHDQFERLTRRAPVRLGGDSEFSVIARGEIGRLPHSRADRPAREQVTGEMST